MHAIDAKGILDAKRLLGLLEQENMRGHAILRQFCLAMKVQLMEYQGASGEEPWKIFW